MGAQLAWKRKGKAMEDTWFFTLVYLKNKSKKKTKQKQLYIQSQTETTGYRKR